MKKIGIVVFTLFVLGFVLFIIYVSIGGSDPQMGEVIDLRSEYVFEDPENYEIEEKNGVNLVKNENLGFSFEIPGDWEVESYSEEIITGEGILAEGLLLLSPGYVSEEKDYFLPNRGCEISIIVYEEYYEYKDGTEYNEADNLKWEIDSILEGKITKDDVTIVEIDNYYGYGLGYEVNSLIRIIRIPIENKIYTIETRFSESEKEKCKESYYNLLNSISFP